MKMIKRFGVDVYEDRFRQAVIDLILPIQQQEFAVPITLSDQPDLADIPSFYGKKNGNFWVAHMDEKVIGTIGLLDLGQQTGCIRKMFVHRDFRGKERGVAQALLDTLLSWCSAKKITNIYLGTISTMKAAHQFYRRNGFISVDKENLPAIFPVMPVDNLFFKLELKPM